MAQCHCTALRAELEALRTQVQALQGQPIEPIYTLKQTAELLFVTPNYLKHLLVRHRAKLSRALYRFDVKHVSHRMLPLSDVRTLRAHLLSPSRSMRYSPEQRAAMAKALGNAA